jgi:DinB superfamily
METATANTEGMFKFNTDIVNKAIADVRPDDWFRKPSDDSNHLMWVMGHLVVHRGHTLKTLGVDWNISWIPLFARGAKRVADTEYPSPEEMLKAWNQVSAELSAALSQAPSEVLEQAAPAGPPSFDGTVSGTVAFFAFHDTYHVGQISYLRKWLGYGQTVG